MITKVRGSARHSPYAGKLSGLYLEFDLEVNYVIWFSIGGLDKTVFDSRGFILGCI